MAKKKAAKPGKRKRPKQLGPQSDQDKKFCERWLIHFDKDRAWQEAGFPVAAHSGRLALNKLQKFTEYLRPIQEAKAKIMAERLAVDTDQVLEAMTKRVFYDPADFYELTAKPLTEMVKKKGAKAATEQVRMWDGRPVYGERLKPFSALSAEQRAVVEITGEAGGVIRYRLPSIREQHMYLTSLGRQYGMFAEKLIIERQTHKHMHHHLSFDGVPTPKLQQLQRQMMPLVGLEFAQQLGYTPEEFEQAQKDEGVVMTVPEKAGAG